MKKLVLLFVVVSLFTTNNSQAQTHFSVESQNLLNSSGTTPTLTSFLTHSFNNYVGMFSWFFVNEYWAESYTGLTLSPKKYCQFGAGLGLEQSKKLLRVGGFVWLGNQKYQSLTLLETGQSGYWYRSTVNFNLTHWFGAGAIAEKNLGMGPRIEINVPKSHVQLWFAGLYKEQWSKYFSIKLNF